MIYFTAIPFLFLVSILVHAEIKKNMKRIKIFKPLCSLLLVAYVLFSPFSGHIDTVLFSGILTAMLFSLGGDISLIFQNQKKFFLFGLVLFLLGHISYGITFSLLSDFILYDLFTALLLAVLFAVLLFLFKSGAQGIPASVIAYMLIISFMMNRAFSTRFSDSFSLRQSGCIIAGSALFYISDVLLAWNRFYKPFRYHRISLFFYYSGQFLIISSLYG